MNWTMIQALATVALVVLAAVDSAVYYFWHAKHERQQDSNPYSPENIKRLQEEHSGKK